MVLSNLKSILKNLRFNPQKALITSYPLVNSNEVSATVIVILAVLFGLSNAFTQKYLPVSLISSINSRIGKAFSTSYSPNIFKYFAIGVVLFIISLLACTVIGYAIKTKLFKQTEDFFLILKTTTICLIPGTIFLFLSSIFATFSVLLYFVFLVLSISLFIIYFYQHLCNINAEFNDKICFICSILLIVLVFIFSKINSNTDIASAVINLITTSLSRGL